MVVFLDFKEMEGKKEYIYLNAVKSIEQNARYLVCTYEEQFWGILGRNGKEGKGKW